MHIMRLKDNSIWNVQYNDNDNWSWKCLLELRDKIASQLQFKIGDGKGISMWFDKWHNSGLLINSIT